MAVDEGAPRAALFAAVARAGLSAPETGAITASMTSTRAAPSSTAKTVSKVAEPVQKIKEPKADESNKPSNTSTSSSEKNAHKAPDQQQKQCEQEAEEKQGDQKVEKEDGDQEDEGAPKRERAPVGAAVITSFGAGKVKEFREDSATPYVIALEFGGVAHVAETEARWKKKLHEMTNTDKVEAAVEHKEKGNEKFKMQAFKDAITAYELALIYARQVKDDELRSECEPLMISLFQNLSIAQLRQGLFAEAVHNASEALQLNAKSVKALFFRAKAEKMRGNYSDASRDLALAIEMDPTNTELRAEVKLIRKELAATAEKERKMYGGLLSGDSNKGQELKAGKEEKGHEERVESVKMPSPEEEQEVRNDKHQFEGGDQDDEDDEEVNASVLLLAGGLAVVASLAAIGYLLAGKGKK